MHCRSLLLGICLWTSAAGAAPSLPPILISAARTAQPGLDIPASTRVIDRREIEDSGARYLAELLRRVTGVHISDGVGDGGSARIDMRGFGDTAQSNVAVLINGRKINPATDSAALYLNSIDLERVEQIEVIEGSAGTLYGNQAVGGLINIVTDKPVDRSRYVRAGAGSYNAREVLAGLSERLGDAVGIGLQAHRRDSDNYRDHNASEVERFDLRLELDHRGGGSYADVQLLDDFVQTPGALFANELAANRRQAVFPGDYLDTRSRVLRLGTRQTLDTHWQFEGELALRDDKRKFVQSFRGFPGGLSTQDRESIELSPRLVGRFDGSLITLGMDVLTTDYLLISTFGPQGNEQDILAWYGQLTQSLGDKLSLTAGLRHARVDNDINDNGAPVRLDDDLTVGSLGLVYRPDSAWRLFMRADQNYRFAKVDEHTNVVFGQPPGLKNQRGVSYETGAAYTADNLSLSARAFHLLLKNEISFDSTSFNTNINLPRSRRTGLALSADLVLTPGLDLGGGIEHLDATISSGVHDGSRVPLVPKYRANLYLAYRPRADWLLRLDVDYVDEQFLGSDFANASMPLPAYKVAGLVAHHDRGDWRFTAKANNLFNESYSETGAASFFGDGFNPAPERNFWVGASYRFEE